MGKAAPSFGPALASAPPPATEPQTGPGAPPPPPSLSTAGASGFDHPNANRQALLQGLAVAYRFERSRRKSIGLSVGPEGLVVRAPHWVPLREVDAAVQEKARWIVAKLQQTRERAQQHAPTALTWEDGATLPYLGGTLRLCVQTPEQSASAQPPADPCLHLSLPPHASPTQVREAAQAWFKKQAQQLFEQRLNHFAPQLGVQWQRLSLSNANTRWGSARSDGHIRLNWRLIHLPLAQIDYVVVHELAHLRVMDHSPRFWDTVGSVMPDYPDRRRQLRKLG